MKQLLTLHALALLAGGTLAQTLTSGGPVRGVSATASQGRCSSMVELMCSLGAMAPGQVVTIVQTARPQRTGTLVTTATAGTASDDPTPGNNQASASTTVRKR